MHWQGVGAAVPSPVEYGSPSPVGMVPSPFHREVRTGRPTRGRFGWARGEARGMVAMDSGPLLNLRVS